MVSIVVPVFNEAESLPLLYRRLTRALANVHEIDYEILMVDDGSRDHSWEVIGDLRSNDRRVKGVRFTRNFGHQAAVTAGLRYAAGDAVITMDSDLQHPPEMVPAMLERWRMGFDVVSMVREQAEHQGLMKSATSRWFYRVINSVSEVQIKSGVADFRLLDRRVVRKLNSLKERRRFVRGLISWVGFRETELSYVPQPRMAGESKYSWSRMLRLAADGISSFSTAPLRLSLFLGLIASMLCVGLMGYAVYNKVMENKDLTEWASTFLTMLFLSGVQLLMIGVLGVYVGRIFEEVKGRPVFIAEEELGTSLKLRQRRRITTA